MNIFNETLDKRLLNVDIKVDAYTARHSKGFPESLVRENVARQLLREVSQLVKKTEHAHHIDYTLQMFVLTPDELYEVAMRMAQRLSSGMPVILGDDK